MSVKLACRRMQDIEVNSTIYKFEVLQLNHQFLSCCFKRVCNASTQKEDQCNFVITLHITVMGVVRSKVNILTVQCKSYKVFCLQGILATRYFGYKALTIRVKPGGPGYQGLCCVVGELVGQQLLGPVKVVVHSNNLQTKFIKCHICFIRLEHDLPILCQFH